MRIIGSVVIVFALLVVPARAGDDAKPAADLVVGYAPRSWIAPTFRVPGWSYDAATTRQQRAAIGENVVLVGHGFGGKATVSLIAERDEPHAPSGTWRAKYSSPDDSHFDVGDVAC